MTEEQPKPYDLKFLKKHEHLHFNVKGERSLESLKKLVEDIAVASKKHKNSKVLVDLSEFGEPLDILSSWEVIASHFDQHVQGVVSRGAIIENEKSYTLTRFYERASRNLGHDLRVFTYVQKAKDWLIGG